MTPKSGAPIGAGGKTCLESSITKLTPILFVTPVFRTSLARKGELKELWISYSGHGPYTELNSPTNKRQEEMNFVLFRNLSNFRLSERVSSTVCFSVERKTGTHVHDFSEDERGEFKSGIGRDEVCMVYIQSIFIAVDFALDRHGTKNK